MSVDLLFALMGAPHQTDLVTTVLRLVQAALDRGARVQVWACGDATLLTRADLGDEKPRDLHDWTAEHPSTAVLVRDLVAGAGGRASWCVCRFCSEERGAGTHVAGVRVRPPFRFAAHVADAGTTVYAGAL